MNLANPNGVFVPEIADPRSSAISYARHTCNVSIVSRNGCKWYEGEINRTSILYLGGDSQ